MSKHETFYDCEDCGRAALDHLCMSCLVRRGLARFGLGAYGIRVQELAEQQWREVAGGRVSAELRVPSQSRGARETLVLLARVGLAVTLALESTEHEHGATIRAGLLEYD